MPVYEVTMFQQYANQEVVNRWNYRANPNIVNQPDSADLLNAMGFIPNESLVYPTGTIFAGIRAFQVAAVVTRAVYARSLYDPADFYELVYTVPPVGLGAGGGEGMPPFVALGFRSNRPTQLIRRATKRFVGIGEANVGAGGTVSLGGAIISNIANPMAATLVGQGLANYFPIVASKQRVIDPDTDSVSYRYFPTEAEQVSNSGDISSWTAYPQVRSQTSRQYGRGR